MSHPISLCILVELIAVRPNTKYIFLATNCSLLSCGEREECVQVNDIFQCVCKDDYEEPDCSPSKEYQIFISFLVAMK